MVVLVLIVVAAIVFWPRRRVTAGDVGWLLPSLRMVTAMAVAVFIGMLVAPIFG